MKRSGCNRLVQMVLCLAVLISAIFLCSYTETDDFFRYEVKNDGTAEIVGYTGFDHTVRFPSELHGYMVTSIAETALYGNEQLRKVIISKGIREIEADAFAYCLNLNTVILEEDSVVSIAEAAFEGCALLESLTLPDGLQSIDDFAFSGCIRLREVKLPASLSSIGYQSFADCEQLILNCEDNELGLVYAKENDINTEFTQSSTLQWFWILGGSAILLVTIFLMFRFVKQRKGFKK